MNEYDIYYDESKEGGYWHGILFLPSPILASFSSHLNEARSDLLFRHRLHFVRLGEQEPINSPRTKLTESFISIGCAALQQQKFVKYLPKARVGKNLKIIEPIRAKFAVYRITVHTMKNAGPDRNYLITNTLASALKGSLHYLFGDREKVVVRRIIYEGKKGQGIDDRFVLNSLKRQIRDHVIHLPEEFVFMSSDHNLSENRDNISDCNILQLCDSLLGAVRFSVLPISSFAARKKVSIPVSAFLEYANEPFARMKQSRFFKGFSLSQAEKQGAEWKFENLQKMNRIDNLKQQNLI